MIGLQTPRDQTIESIAQGVFTANDIAFFIFQNHAFSGNGRELKPIESAKKRDLFDKGNFLRNVG